MRMVCRNKRSLVTIYRYQLLPRRHDGHPWPSIRQTVHWGRTLSYIFNLLLFRHYMLWIIKISPWRPERNAWFRRGNQSVNATSDNIDTPIIDIPIDDEEEEENRRAFSTTSRTMKTMKRWEIVTRAMTTSVQVGKAVSGTLTSLRGSSLLFLRGG